MIGASRPGDKQCFDRGTVIFGTRVRGFLANNERRRGDGRRRRAGQSAPLIRWARESGRSQTSGRSPMAVAAFFAGIGGIELGLHRAGHRTVLLCENDAGAQAVLERRFPEIPLRGDVREVRSLPRGIDLLTAGFPCQDLSQAGTTQGITGARSGLVGEIFRLLRRQRVPWLLLENVPFMLQLARGRALEVIIGELERLGYRWAYRVIDSRAFGLPQRRLRVFLLASRDEDPRDVLLTDDAGPLERETSPNPVACGFYWTEGVRGLGWAENAVPTLKGGSGLGIPSPPAIVFPSGRIVTPDLRDAERLQGFRADWTKPAESAVRSGMRWKLVGNAVSVPTAAWIGRKLVRPGRYDGSWDVELPEGAPWPRSAWNLGDRRFTSEASPWPSRMRRPPLAEFLRFPGPPLSARAAAGFRSRTRISSLNFPPGFLAAVDAHIRRMREIASDDSTPDTAVARV